MPRMNAADALTCLREGNRRFVTEGHASDAPTGHDRRRELLAGQKPVAIVLGCSDSRVPLELIFDQGLGDLFVIRVAGNIVAPSQVASVEFAAERLAVRLVVVLGHTACGAITATVEELESPRPSRSPNLPSIVDRIRPAVLPLLQTELRHDRKALICAAGRANVKSSADHLRHGSPVLEELIRDHGLLVVGAEYSLESGIVDFFDGVPLSGSGA